MLANPNKGTYYHQSNKIMEKPTTSGNITTFDVTDYESEGFILPDPQFQKKKLKRRKPILAYQDESDDSSTSQNSQKNQKKAIQISSQQSIADVEMESAQITPKPVKIFQMAKKRKMTTADESNPQYTHPIGKAPREQPAIKTALQNKYSPPNISVPVPADMNKNPIPRPDEPEITTETAASTVALKPKRPPPIVVHGRFDNHKTINAYLIGNLKENFFWRHGRDTTSLQTLCLDDWRTASRYMEIDDVEYHTYTPKGEKSHAFIIKGIYHNVEVADLKEELTREHGIPVRELFTLKGTRYPMYMLVTNNNIAIKELQQKIKHLDKTRITWERHMNNKVIIQCHRCQMWGHATSNCKAAPKCLKCAMNHQTRDCKKPVTDTPKCANCQGAHTANNIVCPIYQRKIAIINQNSARVVPAPQTRYVAAPPPKSNAWENRQGRQQDYNIKDFPPLPRNQLTQFSQPTQLTPRPANGPVPRKTLLPTPQTGDEEDKNETLQRWCEELNTLIDIDVMIERVRTLTIKLRTCKTEGARFETYYKYILSLNN